MSAEKSKLWIWPLVLYAPISCLLVGLLSTMMRLSVPGTGSRTSSAVFWAHALRFPEDFSLLLWASLGLGWLILLLMTIALRSRKPIVTLAELRIVLLVLIVVITLLVHVYSVVLPFAGKSQGGPFSYEVYKKLTSLLFLFVDVDLIIVFAATYLPLYKTLKRRMI